MGLESSISVDALDGVDFPRRNPCVGEGVRGTEISAMMTRIYEPWVG